MFNMIFENDLDIDSYNVYKLIMKNEKKAVMVRDFLAEKYGEDVGGDVRERGVTGVTCSFVIENNERMNGK